MKRSPDRTTGTPLDELLHRLAERAESPLTRSWAKALLKGEGASSRDDGGGGDSDDERQ
jgi:hypothetical protein